MNEFAILSILDSDSIASITTRIEKEGNKLLDRMDVYLYEGREAWDIVNKKLKTLETEIKRVSNIKANEKRRNFLEETRVSIWVRKEKGDDEVKLIPTEEWKECTRWRRKSW